MYRILMLSAAAAFALTACKPTPRTANAKARPAQQSEQAPTAPTAPAASPAPAGAEVPQAPEATQAPLPQQEVAASILAITSTRQDFSRLRPWEKENNSTAGFMGVYLGEGRVLTVGNAARAATYVEISLPDGSRSVPARVQRYDSDLNLALLTPVHEADASLFDSRKPLQLGEALTLGDTAELDALVRGMQPVRIALLAESSEVTQLHPLLSMPRLSLRAAQPVPEGSMLGLPILREGKLAGLSSGGNRDTQSIFCINAELIARFLRGEDGEHATSPMAGIDTTHVNDPVLRAYLKLPEGQGGIYVNEVYPGSAAEQAGLRVGDVITSIDELAIDTRGRCLHPLYGAIDAKAVLRSWKPVGDTMQLAVSRDGEKLQLELALNREVFKNHLLGATDAPGTQPRYAMWGGLLFQPMTQDFMMAFAKRTKSAIPVPFREAESREKEWREKGVTELVMLTLVIPTPATLSYDDMGCCLVESVNGKTVHNFAEFVQLLDEPTPDGLVAFGLNKAPYSIYVDRRTAEAANSAIRRGAIQQLRNLGQDAPAAAPAAEADAPAPDAAPETGH